MDVQELIQSFTDQGIMLWIDGEKLKYRAPKDTMQKNHIQQLKEYKFEIIDYLKASSQLVHDEKGRYDSFPLTDMQKAYAIGRQSEHELGGVGCKSYVEIKFSHLSPQKFEESWHTLIQHHDILRTIVTDNYIHNYIDISQFPSLVVNDFREEEKKEQRRKFLTKRHELQTMQFTLNQWPLHHFELSLFEEYSIVHFVIDMIIGDFVSVHQMMNELMRIYNNQELPQEEITFRDAVTFDQVKQKTPNEQHLYLRDKNYWMNKISEMPLHPELPVNVETFDNTAVSFTRYPFTLTETQWSSFKIKCQKFNVTPSNAVLTVYRDLIQQYALNDLFSINITLMNRHQYDKKIDQVIGDFTSVNVMDASVDGEILKERAKQIQEELFANMDHKRFNGIEVLRELSKHHGTNVVIPVVYTSTLGMEQDNQQRFDIDYGVSETPQVLIDCQVFEQSGGFTCHLDIRDKAFDTSFIDSFVTQFRELMIALSEQESYWLSSEFLQPQYQGESLVKHHHHEVKLADIDSRMMRLNHVNKAYTIQKGSDDDSVLQTFISPYYEWFDHKEDTHAALRKDLINISRDAFAAVDEKSFQLWKDLSELTSLTDMLSVFQSADIFKHAGEFMSEQDIFNQLKVSDKYLTTVKRWLKALSGENYISLKEGDYALTFLGKDKASQNHQYWEQFEQIEAEIGYSQTLFQYQKESSNKLLAQIQGDVNGLDLFFPQGKTDIAMAAYNSNLVNKGLNTIVKEAVKRVCLQNSEPINILEVGGGVAATTIDVLPALQSFNMHYDFTDISQYFLNHGKEILSTYEGINYKLFDINQPYQQQGFDRQSYDIILCPNVLHNSEHALLVLNQLNDMLKPGGYLIMIEATMESYSLLTSLELKGGLDNFQDSRKSSSETFFNRKSWRNLLESAHFKPIVMLPEENEIIHESGQSVIVSQTLSPSLAEIEKQINTDILFWPKYMQADEIEVTNQIPSDAEAKALWTKKQMNIVGQQLNEKNISMPKYQLEESLLDILKTLLERDDVGVEDNFYQIGGDSLLVAKWITEVQSKISSVSSWSFEALMKTFTKQPTARAFAHSLTQVNEMNEITVSAEVRNELPSYLKVLHDTDKKPRVVKALFHAGTGRLLDYNYLLPHLIDDSKNDEHIYGFVYGSVSDYLNHSHEQLVESLALKYAEALIRIDAEEYELYGYCVGGFLAVETARILIENGKKVAPVNAISSHLCLHHVSNTLLMEAAFANIIGADLSKIGYNFTFKELSDALTFIVQEEIRDISDQELIHLDEPYKAVGKAFNMLNQLSQSERLQRIYNSIPDRDFNGTNNTVEKLTELYEVFNQTYLGMIHYKPEPFLGDVRVFDPIEYVTDFYPKTKADTPWSSFVLGELEERKIDGNHATCMEYTQIKSLADALQ